MSITINLNSTGISYTENQGNLILFGSAIFFSNGGSLVDTVEITLDSASLTESLAVFSLPNGYTSFYDSNTGLLTISSDTGDISDANWESVLRSVQYSNSSDNPPGTRIITVVASDTVGETSDSNTAVDTITITAINDAPALIAPLVDQAVQYDPNTVGWNYDAGASFSDGDISDSLIYSATLANGNPLPAWIHISETTGLMTGLPGFDDRGTYALKVTATDTHGLLADGTLTVAVTAFDAGRLLVSTNGNDALAGTLSNDTVTYAYATAPVAVSLAITASQNTGSAGSDTLTNIDNLIGSNFSDNLTGNTQNNVLDGGIGADTLVGGLGNDSYIVDIATDIVTERLNGGVDKVNSSVTYRLPGNVENLTLIGTSAINGTGNALANIIIGNTANNTLNGSTGTDTLIGKLGDDTFVVNSEDDVVIEDIAEGTDRINSSVTYVLPTNVENLTLTGTLAINGTGNSLANTLTGNSAANQLDGGANADILKGGAGDDTYFVDNAGDIVTEALNAGIDTVNSSVSHTLKSNVENLNLTGILAINGTGNNLANLITGNAANNTLNGGGGADTLVGGLGNDNYIVDNVGDIVNENSNEGIDRIFSSVTYTLPDNVEHITMRGTSAINVTGNGLTNYIYGNAADNHIIGGAGDDWYFGGGGDNILTGGVGKDYFHFITPDYIELGHIDFITDFNVIDDTIKLGKTVFTEFTNPFPSAIAPGQFIIGSQALDADDFIIYNSGTGALLYDADGSGSDAAVQFATVSIGLAMTYADFHVI